METLKLIHAVIASMFIIILLIVAERKWSHVERIIGKKLKVVYYPNSFCVYKLSPVVVDGYGEVFLTISNGEYSCFWGDRVDTIKTDKYEVEICYGKNDPVLNVLHRRYEPWVLNLIFAGKFLPKYKCVFNLPSSKLVRQGKITVFEPPIIMPKPVVTFTPTLNE